MRGKTFFCDVAYENMMENYFHRKFIKSHAILMLENSFVNKFWRDWKYKIIKAECLSLDNFILCKHTQEGAAALLLIMRNLTDGEEHPKRSFCAHCSEKSAENKIKLNLLCHEMVLEVIQASEY